jgi:hypothetical protein
MWCVGRWMLGSQYGLAVWLRDGWEGGERGGRGRARVKKRGRERERETERERKRRREGERGVLGLVDLSMSVCVPSLQIRSRFKDVDVATVNRFSPRHQIE